MVKLRYFIALFCLLASGGLVVQGQDIHFSQFYHSPLNLNPAFSGQTEGKYRVVGNYRHQWADVGPSDSKIPFVTYAASYDRPIPVSLSEGDQVGAGIQFFQDKAGKVGLTNKSVFFSGSYRFKWAEDSRHTFMIGLQGGMVEKSIDKSELVFADQIKQQGTGIKTKEKSKESVAEEAITYFDLNSGLFWTMEVFEELDVNAGMSLFHLTQPKEDFTGVSQADNQLDMRATIHAGARYKINDKMNLLPGLLLMNQTRAQEFNLGSNITYQLTQEENGFKGTLFGGVWTRMSAFNQIVDAVVPTVGIQRGPVKVGISYDVNVSSLTAASRYRGGPEFAVIYIPKPLDPEIKKQEVPCIRF